MFSIPRFIGAAAASVGAAATQLFTGDNNQVNDYFMSKKRVHARLPPTRPLLYPAGADFPDLREHNNYMKEHLTPDIYAKYRDVVSLHTT